MINNDSNGLECIGMEWNGIEWNGLEWIGGDCPRYGRVCWKALFCDKFESNVR
jgi:hypothetical protein